MTITLPFFSQMPAVQSRIRQPLELIDNTACTVPCTVSQHVPRDAESEAYIEYCYHGCLVKPSSLNAMAITFLTPYSEYWNFISRR